MYTPPAFSVADRDWSLELISQYPFGTLVTQRKATPQITHLPMMAESRDGELFLIGHVARANPHADEILAGGVAATGIFVGAHAYVSASWYEKPYETVPTWNYEAVHCSGTLQEGDAFHTLEMLTWKFEAGRENGWKMERLDVEYLEKQLRGIVAFEMRVDELLAKAKLSQNRSGADRERVATALEASPYEIERACALAMRH